MAPLLFIPLAPALTPQKSSAQKRSAMQFGARKTESESAYCTGRGKRKTEIQWLILGRLGNCFG
jgi:hypothetical protein